MSTDRFVYLVFNTLRGFFIVVGGPIWGIASMAFYFSESLASPGSVHSILLKSTLLLPATISNILTKILAHINFIPSTVIFIFYIVMSILLGSLIIGLFFSLLSKLLKVRQVL